MRKPTADQVDNKRRELVHARENDADANTVERLNSELRDLKNQRDR